MAITLVDNASQWWKFWSVRLAVLSAALAAAIPVIGTLPPDVQVLLPVWFKQGLAMLASLSAILVPFARVIVQPSVPSNPPDGP